MLQLHPFLIGKLKDYRWLRCHMLNIEGVQQCSTLSASNILMGGPMKVGQEETKVAHFKFPSYLHFLIEGDESPITKRKSEFSALKTIR